MTEKSTGELYNQRKFDQLDEYGLFAEPFIGSLSNLFVAFGLLLKRPVRTFAGAAELIFRENGFQQNNTVLLKLL